MVHSTQDTIAAIATAPGDAGVAIVRVSGPGALDVADRVFRCRGAKPSERDHGTFVYGHVVDRASQVVDEALLLIMRSPRSYTGDPTAEIQCHGGSHVARRVLRCVLDAGVRTAEPGEFTRRAFLNGKLDILQAEAVLDLINARSERAATAAREQLSGSLTKSFTDIYDTTLGLAANLEATLDFPDDELPADILTGLTGQLSSVIARAEGLMATWDEGHLLRDGASIVISGKPNVGKSTLLNTLLGRDRAIVSHIPGTTRDVLEEGFVIAGIPARLIDTAGLRDADCEIEQEGIRRTHLQMADADLHIYVIDASQLLDVEDLRNTSLVDSARLILVLNKIDLAAHPASALPPCAAIIRTCLRDGRGVAELRSEIERVLLSVHHVGEGQRAVISERHRLHLGKAVESLKEAHGHLARTESESDIAASLLRDAVEEIGQIIGRNYSVDLIDQIFSRFCIGK